MSMTPKLHRLFKAVEAKFGFKTTLRLHVALMAGDPAAAASLIRLANC